nr:MAG TPA: hypothetical protein [Caudoviricetes sp.]
MSFLHRTSDSLSPNISRDVKLTRYNVDDATAVVAFTVHLHYTFYHNLTFFNSRNFCSLLKIITF